MPDNARVYSDPAVVEWEPDPRALVSAARELVEWEPLDTARVDAMAQIVEWVPPEPARVLAMRALVEWAPATLGRVTAVTQLVEWAPADAGLMLSEALLVEWIFGNVIDAERGKFRLKNGFVVQPYGRSHNRVPGDWAAAQQTEEDGEPIDPTPQTTGGRALGKYTNPESSPVWGLEEP